jgi:hypothetical protein
VSSGDPHGAASATPEGHYLSDLLYGTKTLTSDEAARLNTDPYSLKVSDGQTQNPYDYYWGGFNTITGGKTGVGGDDGWYFSGFASELADLRSTVGGLGLNQGRTNALTVKLDQVKKLQASGQSSEAAAVLGDFITQVTGFGQAGIISAPEADRVVSNAQQLLLFLNSGAPKS